MVNSPALFSAFVGRQDELAQISRLLSDSACPLLTLVGPGGIGKTRLALETARQFPEAHFVALQPLTSPDFIVSTIADAVGLQFYSGDPKQQLLDYLREKSGLLVLDNFEHLLAGADLLSTILAAAPAIRLLVTSRERLNLVEEWVLDVGGLAYPLTENKAADSYSAVALFVQRACRVKSSFALTDANRPAVIRICRLVGGMPLAIELAASWVRALSCEAIAGEIERSLDILETPARNVEPRHRTMRAAFAPTWEHLSDDERAVFMKLSVFRGGFTREAAEEVAGASLRTLSTLVDKSLLRVDANSRYDVHELLRQFAEDKLTETGEKNTITARYLNFFIMLAEQFDSHVYGRDTLVWFKHIENDLENLRSALFQAEHTRQAEDGLRLSSALHWFWSYRGRQFEGADWIMRLLALKGMVSIPVRMKALARLGDWAAIREVKGAAEYLDEALVLARSVYDEEYIAWALAGLAILSCDSGDFDDGALKEEESLALFRKIDNHFGMSHLFLRRGQLAVRLGDFAYARKLFEEAMICARADDARDRVAWALVGQAMISAQQEQDFEQAAGQLEESMALFQELEDLGGLARVLNELGNVEYLRENNNRAAMYYRETLHLTGHNGMSRFDANTVCLVSLGKLAIRQRHFRRAARLLAAVEVYRNAGIAFATFDQDVEALRQQLGEAAFASAWSEGKAMTREQAIDYAEEKITSPAKTGPANQALHATLPDSLNEREMEILRLIADGLSNGEIAQQLVLAPSTVKWYINRIFSKLSVTSRTQAIIRARELSLLS